MVTLNIEEKGASILQCELPNEISANTWSDVLYVPDLQCKMLSASTLGDRGFSRYTVLKMENAYLKNDEVYFQAFKSNGV